MGGDWVSLGEHLLNTEGVFCPCSGSYHILVKGMILNTSLQSPQLMCVDVKQVFLTKLWVALWEGTNCNNCARIIACLGLNPEIGPHTRYFVLIFWMSLFGQYDWCTPKFDALSDDKEPVTKFNLYSVWIAPGSELGKVKDLFWTLVLCTGCHNLKLLPRCSLPKIIAIGEPPLYRMVGRE